MNLKIGNLILDNPLLLAPLAGITDQAMRSLCYQAGASLTYTEMVSAKGLWYGDRKTSDLLAIGEEEGPVAYQLFGSEPVVLAHGVYELSEAEHEMARGLPETGGRGDAHGLSEAADRGDAHRLSGSGRGEAHGLSGAGRQAASSMGIPVGGNAAGRDAASSTGLPVGGTAAGKIPGPPPKPWPGYSNDRRPVLFDLNAGCPVPKIVKNGEGSALLKDPDLLYDCVSAMVDASRRAARTGAGTDGDPVAVEPRPVTVKIRKGFYRDEDLSLENAKAIEAAGAAAITVHGRCREQYYEGKADWDCIARVKDEVSIPVIGNGDVMTGADAIRMMEYTGCDGVMIARGALGNPWIFTEAVKLIEMIDSGMSPADALPLYEVFRKVSDEERIQTLLKHMDLVAKFKDEYTAVREMRKHVGWYIKGMHGAAEIRRKVNNITDFKELKETIASIPASQTL